MKIYFVRHGQSELNAHNIHQPSTVSLSQKGKHQATFVSKRFESISIDALFSSDFTRAYETAQIICGHINKPVEINILLREIKRPTEIHGKSIYDKEAVRIKTLIKNNIHVKDWHYSDEENIFDLMHRCKEYVQSLTTLQHENILVVSHGMAIRMIILCMMFAKEELIIKSFEDFTHFMHTSNTGITICQRNTDNTFQLLTWNDYTHVA